MNGSTSGVTTADPSISAHDDDSGEPLFKVTVWDLRSQNVVLQPGEFVTLQFQTTANAPEGAYCNEAWADPGVKETGTGATAKVTEGAPASGLCDTEAVLLTKATSPACGRC